jgi:hypothetical protein
MSGKLAGNHWLPRWDEIDDNLIQGWDSNNGNSGLNSLIHSLYQVNNDYSDDGRGFDIGGNGWTHWELGHGDYQGWGEGDTTLEGIIPKAYLDYLEPDTLTSSGV